MPEELHGDAGCAQLPGYIMDYHVKKQSSNNEKATTQGEIRGKMCQVIESTGKESKVSQGLILLLICPVISI